MFIFTVFFYHKFKEIIGDYATVEHQRHGDTRTDPICDYKMVDQNYELLPFLSDYFLYDSLGKNRATLFFANKRKSDGMTYSQILEKNIQLVLAAAKKFNDQPTANNLVQFNPGFNVGNWRDSEIGNI